MSSNKSNILSAGDKRAWIFLFVVIFLLSIPILREFREYQIHENVSRVRSDQRTIASALENYYVDHGSYPAWAIGKSGANAGAESGSIYSEIPTFRIHIGSEDTFHTLIKPKHYIPNLWEDVFAPNESPNFGYWSSMGDWSDSGVTDQGWLLWSPGPDKEFDITDPGAIYNPSESRPSDALILRSYDPTNGTISRGDIWRIKWNQ